MAADAAELVVRITGEVADVERKLDQTTKAVSSFGDKIKSAGAAAAKAGAALGAAVGVAAMVGFNGALENEQASANLAAQLGLNEKGAEIAGKNAGDLYASNFGSSVAAAGDAIAAVFQGGLAGIDDADADIQRITSKVITFSEVFSQDMGESVATVSALLSNKLVPDADTAMDQLTTSMQRVPVNLRGELLSALTEYSPFFNQLGINAEEAMSALVRASDGGTIAIDKTGDALKELVIRVQDGSKLTSEAMKGLGLDGEKIAAGFAAGGPAATNAMSEIIGALASVDDPVKQTQLGVALLGTPFEDLGVHALPTLQALGAGLGDTADAAQKMVDQVGGTNAAKLETFRRSMETNVNNVSEKAIGWLVQLPGPVQTAAATFAGMAPALAPLSPLLAAFGPGLLNVAKSFVTTAASAIASTVTTVAQIAVQGAKWAWLGIQSLLGAGKVALAWLIAMGPIALVVAAVIAAVALIVANWDWVKENVGRVVGAIGDFLGNLIESVVGFVQEWGILLLGPIGAIWKFRDQIGETLGNVVGFFVALPGRIIAAISSLAGRLWDTAWDAMERMSVAIYDKATALLGWFGELPGRIFSALGDLGSLLWDAGQSIVTGLWNGIKSMGGWLWDQVTSFISRNIPGPVKKVLGISSPSKVFAEFGVNIGEGLAGGIMRSHDMVAAASASLSDAVMNPARDREAWIASMSDLERATISASQGFGQDNISASGGYNAYIDPTTGEEYYAKVARPGSVLAGGTGAGVGQGIDYTRFAEAAAEANVRRLVPALAREMLALMRSQGGSEDAMHVAREIAWRTGG